MSETLFFLDFETTGVNQLDDSPLTVGMVAYKDRMEVGSYYQRIEFFESDINLDTKAWAKVNCTSEVFEEMYSTELDRLTHYEVGRELTEFINFWLNLVGDEDTANLVCDHTHFDYVFFKRLLTTSGYTDPFSKSPFHRMISVGSLRITVPGWEKFERDEETNHHALHDARTMSDEYYWNREKLLNAHP